jgi:putative endopeptidase
MASAHSFEWILGSTSGTHTIISYESDRVFLSSNLYLGGIFLPEMYYNDSSISDTYLDTLESVFGQVLPILFNKTLAPGESKEIGKDVLAFETAIALFTAKKEDTSGSDAGSLIHLDPEKTYNLFKWNELSETAPFLEWSDYRKYNFPSAEYSSFVNDTSKIVVQVPTFLANISLLHEKTPSQTVLYYLIWIVIATHSEALPETILSAIDKTSILVGRKAEKRPTRYKMCVRYLSDHMGEVYAKWFLAKSFDESSKKQAEEMTRMVRDSFVDSFKDDEWVDRETRENAIKKVFVLTAYVIDRGFRG